MTKDDKLNKAFADGRALERQFSEWKFQAIVGKDEPAPTGTVINGKPTATSKAQIRNELRAELRENWKIAQFKGRISPKLKALFRDSNHG